MLERVRDMVNSSPVVMKGEYPYVVLSLTDGVSRMDPEVLREIIDRMKELCDLSDIDLILTPEAMGIPYAVPISLESGIPLSIIRKREYGIEGEVKVVKHTGYATSAMYINGVNKGDRVLLIDDMISTGGTLKALIEGLRSTGCIIVQVLVAIEKGCRASEISKDIGVPVRSVFGMDIIDGRPVFRYSD